MNNELATTETNNNLAGYCSFKAETMEERLKVANAVSSAKSLEDFIGQTFNLKDILIQPVEMTDRATGEVVINNRIILIDEQGNAYSCMSKGVEQFLRNLLSIVGEPNTWDYAIPVTPTKMQGTNGYKFTTLVINS